MFLRFSSSISLTFSLFLLSHLPPVASLACLGVTYSAPSNSSPRHFPPPYLLPVVLESLKFSSLRLEDSDPSIIRSFLYTNVSLFLTIPNYLIPPMATNRSAVLSWLYVHVVPFYPRAKISTISVGNDFVDASPDSVHQLLPAIRNVYLSLRDLGIRKISVSTSFSFVSAISTPFPPSSAQFREPPGNNVIGPLLRFLRDTNSSFLINVYPYNLYRLRSEIPIGIALFQEHAFGFRDDLTTGVRYYNLFDMMIDAVVSAMAVAGYENIPIIVTETGWPSASSAGNEADANMVYAEIYLKGLVKHLKSGKGTPLSKEGLSEVYIYELFDKEAERGKRHANSGRSWGILYPNMSMRYHHIDFSGSSSSTIVGAKMAAATSTSLFLLLVCL